MNRDIHKFIPLSKKGLLSMFSTIALLSSSLGHNVVQAQDTDNLQKISFSNDVEWMKSQIALDGDNIKIDYTNRFPSYLEASTIKLETSSSNTVASVSTDKHTLNLSVKDFGDTTIKVTATDKEGRTLTDQFKLTISKKGDINGDGIITPADALYIYQVISGKLSLSKEELKLLDINGDGKVTNTDASFLMSNYVGKKTETSLQNNYFIKLSEVNDAPTAVKDSYSIKEDETLNIDSSLSVLKNDVDMENGTLTAVKVSDPKNGSLTLNPDGTFTYIPRANFSGKDQFTYKVNDGKSDSKEQVVSIDVKPVNDIPTANASSLNVTEDKKVTGTLSAQDTDGDTLTYNLVQQATKGTVTITDAKIGAFTYKPNENANGEDSFTFKVNDGTAHSKPVKVSIHIQDVNDTPIANADSYAVKEDETLQVNLFAGILKNDTDADIDTLTAIKVSNPKNGSLIFNPDGTFIYVPRVSFYGKDQFTYKVNDGKSDSKEQVVSIDVKPINDIPTAKASTLDVTEDKEQTGTLSGDDVDKDDLTYSLAQQATKGTVTITDPKTGTFTYKPNENANGDDSFTFKVNDGTTDSEPVKVSIHIQGVNDAPTANADSYSVNEDETLTVDTSSSILKNDVDDDNDALTAVKVSSPKNGTLTLNADGAFTYVPHANFAGKDQFTYKANDSKSASEVQVVSIDVKPVNDIPAAKAITLDVMEDKEATGTLSGYDVDKDDLTYSLAQQATKGTVTITDPKTGTFTYTPNENADGDDSFTFKVNDGTADSEPAKVSIHIQGVNDAPTVSDVRMNGKLAIGATLQGSYTFKDLENDAEGSSKYQWYRGSQQNGSDKEAITGANSAQYIVQDADEDKYLFFEVTPIAASGEQTKQTYTSTAGEKVEIKDRVAPTIQSTSPANGATDVPDQGSISITFSEKITGNAGKKIYIRTNNDDAVVAEYRVQDLTITNNTVTIPNPTLSGNTKYYVSIDEGALQDEAGNVFKGLTTKTDWAFTTEEKISMLAMGKDPLTEEKLAAGSMQVGLILSGNAFKRDIKPSDFILNNAPEGTVITDVEYADVSGTFAILYLTNDGLDFDTNITNFSITAKDSALVKEKTVTSNTMEITAVAEEPSLFISEYLQGYVDEKLAIEIYNPLSTSVPLSGYTLEMHIGDGLGNTFILPTPLSGVLRPGLVDVTISEAFDDYMRITRAMVPANRMTTLYAPGHATTAIVLKKDGKIIDVVGDTTYGINTGIIPDNYEGTLVRKSGTNHGSTKYVRGQWNLDQTDRFNYIGYHRK